MPRIGADERARKEVGDVGQGTSGQVSCTGRLGPVRAANIWEFVLQSR